MEMPELTTDMLLHAYSIGVFPMAENRDDPEPVSYTHLTLPTIYSV